MFENKNCNITPIDQASSLRKINTIDEISLIAVTGGKGGVGKTSVAINLSIALSDLHRKVILLDADFGLSNVDVMLGLSAWKNLQHVLSGECSLDEVILDGPHGIQIIPAAPGTRKMADLTTQEHLGLIDSISQLKNPIDYFVIDTAAGIGNGVCLYSQMASNILVVVCDEPASIADAYALIKILSKNGQNKKFSILTNMVESSAHGEQLFDQLYRVSNHFLDATLQHCGYIPHDGYMKKAIQKQQSVLDVYPSSRSSLAFSRIARQIDRWPKSSYANGAVELFLERQLSNQKLNKV